MADDAHDLPQDDSFAEQLNVLNLAFIDQLELLEFPTQKWHFVAQTSTTKRDLKFHEATLCL